MNARRAYSSSLREDQARRTRELIVEALIAQVSDTGRSDLSMNEVAERAGVSVRTVYRHFPSREDLFDAINEELDGASSPGGSIESLDDVRRHIEELIGWFEENPELVEASHVAGLGREVRRRGRARRGAAARAAIDEWLADLPQEQRVRWWAVFRAFFGSHTWRTMRHELGLTEAETRDAMGWVLELMTGDLERRRAGASDGGR